MSLTPLLMVLITSTSDGATTAPPTVTAVARATIVSGVRIAGNGTLYDPAATTRHPLPRPREVACPADTGIPCRLITIDMP